MPHSRQASPPAATQQPAGPCPAPVSGTTDRDVGNVTAASLPAAKSGPPGDTGQVKGSYNAADILAFERRLWRNPGQKISAIKDLFGLSEIGYFQQLNAVLNDPASSALDPLAVARLRRLRDRRRR